MRTAAPTRPRSTVRVTATIALAAVVLALFVGCSHKKKQAAAPSTPSSTPVSTPSTTPTTTPAPKPKPTNPLTGIGAPPTTPVIAVKIDDTAPGRPQVNVDKADVVYIEEAEGGLSRLVAVFGTSKPTVGYVRSTRPSDPELLLQYGKITLAASGGGGDALPILDKSGLKGWIMDRSAPYYYRVARYQSDYINVLLDLAKVAKAVKTPAPRSIGWTFAAAAPAAATAKGQRIVTRVGTQVVEFRWNTTLRKYIRYINGVAQKASDGKYIASANVIVQTCTIVPHPQDTDVNGNPSQFTVTVGTGAVTVFRNGKRVDGTWQRASVGTGTTLKDKAGAVIALSPGNTFVALIRKGVAVQSS